MSLMEMATQAMMLYPKTSGYDDAVLKFVDTLKGEIIQLQYRTIDAGVSQSITVEFNDATKIRLTKFTNNFGNVKIHLKKVN